MKAVFLDLGGVIFDVSPHPVLESLGFHSLEERESIIQRFATWPVHHDYERGKVDSDKFVQELKSFLGIGVSDQEVIDSWNQMILKAFDDVDKIFAACEEIPVYALSNTNAIHKVFLDKYYSDLMGKFEKVFMSQELGERKPHADIYQKALDLAGELIAGEVIFIDDNPDNIKAATDLGFQAFQSVNDIERTLQIIKNSLA